MSNKMLYLYRLLVLTKNRIFKQLLIILGCLIFIAPSPKFTDYHNQQFELFYEDESVIIWHARNLNIQEPTREQHELHGNIWLKDRQEKLHDKVSLLLSWYAHPNYKETLDKYCYLH